jgi:hypothetical protein
MNIIVGRLGNYSDQLSLTGDRTAFTSYRRPAFRPTTKA